MSGLISSGVLWKCGGLSFPLDTTPEISLKSLNVTVGLPVFISVRTMDQDLVKQITAGNFL